MFSKIGGIALGSIMFLSALSTSALAIKCHGNTQIQASGRHIVTPYCQDNYLGFVAREAGLKVSNHEIRENPHIKEETCKVVGYDNRVYSTCAQYLDHGFRNGR